MKKIMFLILISSVFAFSQDPAPKNNKHMIGVDVSTLTGSGLMYRLLDGDWGFKASAYAISSSKEKNNSYAIGLSIQRNIILKPLTRLYALAGTSFRQLNFDRSTDYTKNYFNFGAHGQFVFAPPHGMRMKGTQTSSNAGPPWQSSVVSFCENALPWGASKVLMPSGRPG